MCSLLLVSEVIAPIVVRCDAPFLVRLTIELDFMGVFEVKIQTLREELTANFDMSRVNDCVVHHIKPRFVLLTAKNKRSALMTVQCKSEECSRCCDALYDPDYKERIIELWNKWNPAT